MPSTIVVTTASDSYSHSGTSLRDAIATANTDAAAGTSDTITFSSSLNGDTINLSQGVLELSGAGTGTITVNGGNQITVSGDIMSQDFAVDSGVTAVLTGLTIESGDNYSSNGGGIANAGTLTVNDCTVTENDATSGDGAGIYSTGTLAVNNSTISDNDSLAGSGLYSTGILSVNGSTIAANSNSSYYGTGYGGGIYNSGTATLYSSTVCGSTGYTAEGGGIYNSGTMTVSDSTLSGNAAEPASGPGLGGGIYNSSAAALTLTNTTISGNTAYSSGVGGGVDNAGTLTLLNTIVAGNSATTGPDVDGAVAGSGASSGNLIGDGTDMTGISNGDAYSNQVGTSGSPIDADLGALQNNGGPTDTMALQSGSPAIAAGAAVTTLTAAAGDSDTTIYVGNAAAIASTPGQFYVMVGSEEMEVTSVDLDTNALTVVRGVDGTTAAAQDSGADVILATDQRGAPWQGDLERLCEPDSDADQSRLGNERGRRHRCTCRCRPPTRRATPT